MNLTVSVVPNEFSGTILAQLKMAYDSQIFYLNKKDPNSIRSTERIYPLQINHNILEVSLFFQPEKSDTNLLRTITDILRKSSCNLQFSAQNLLEISFTRSSLFFFCVRQCERQQIELISGTLQRSSILDQLYF